jgi:hypothetical protein
MKLPKLPILLTDWLDTIPQRFHCPWMTKLYGVDGHAWFCPSCDYDEKPAIRESVSA